jgi:MFS family permease
MVPLALVLFTRDGGGDFHRAGLLTAAYSLGAGLGGPLLSRLVDLRGQRGVLVVGGVVSSAALAVIPSASGASASAWAQALSLVLALVAGAATPPLEPALRTLWPSVLPAREVPAAYAVDAAAQELVFVLGPLAVLLAQVGGNGGGLVAAALVGVAGASWFAGSPVSRSWVPVRRERHWLGPLRSSRLCGLYGVVALVGLTVGVPAVALVAYAESVGSPSWAPWLVAANAFGALVGGLVYSAHAPGRGPVRDLRLGLGALVATYALQAATPGAAGVMALLTALGGLGLPPLLTCLFQLVDRLAPPGTTTEAFAWLISAFLAGSSLGAFTAGALADGGLTYVAFLAGAASSLAALAVALPLLRGASGPHGG